MDFSVSSLTACFGQLEVDSTCTGDGPINRLPNEMMHLIMAKLGQDDDVKKVIRLRLVSKRWKAVVEDYCGLKKSLLVNLHKITHFGTSYFEDTFFGFANSKHFTCLLLSTKISSECLSSFLNMFPNIEQLSVYFSNYYCYSTESILDNSLQVYIKSLNSLKLLDLNGLSMTQMSSALSKLEHFSYDALYPDHTHNLLQAIPHLAPNCVRVNFGRSVPFVYDQFIQWHNINPLSLANLTHLRMCIRGSKECARVVHLLSENAILLQHLDFDTSFGELKLTPTVLEDLVKLTYLTNISLNYIKISFSKLDRTALQHRLTSLTSVLTFKLRAFFNDKLFGSINGDRFTRALSIIFPNLVELDLTFIPYMDNSARAKAQALQLEIEQHLDRFPNLRKHKFKV